MQQETQKKNRHKENKKREKKSKDGLPFVPSSTLTICCFDKSREERVPAYPFHGEWRLLHWGSLPNILSRLCFIFLANACESFALSEGWAGKERKKESRKYSPLVLPS